MSDENEADCGSESGNAAVTEHDPWDVAPRYVSYLGSISQMVAGCARALMTDPAAQRPGTTVVLSTSEFPTERLFQSPSVIAHFYYALATYHPVKLAERRGFEPKELVTMVAPVESALLIMITYFYRRILARSDPKEAIAFSRQMQCYIDLAHLFGRSVPGIGVPMALMTAAGRYLGWGAFMARDIKIYKKYRVGIKLKKVPFDFKLETELWAATHVHIACSMLQAFGFGVNTIEAYANGILSPDPQKLSGEARKFASTQQWLDTLIRTGKAPAEPISSDLCPLASGLAELQALVQTQEDETSATGGWLFSRRTDLSPEKTPGLTFDYSNIAPSKHAVETRAEDAEES